MAGALRPFRGPAGKRHDGVRGSDSCPAPRLGVDRVMSALGLTSAEAEARLAKLGPNIIATRPRVRLISRIGHQLRDPLLILLICGVVLTLLLGDLVDAAVITAVIVVNTTVGVVQEIRADKAITALSDLSAPQARVIRDGDGATDPGRGRRPR